MVISQIDHTFLEIKTSIFIFNLRNFASNTLFSAIVLWEADSLNS